MKHNIIFEYYKTQTLKIGERKYKYILLWVDTFIKHLLNNFNLISVDLIKRELEIFYNNRIMKGSKHGE